MQIQLPDIQLLNDAVLIVWKYKLIQNETEREEESVIKEDDRISDSTADSRRNLIIK